VLPRAKVSVEAFGANISSARARRCVRHLVSEGLLLKTYVARKAQVALIFLGLHVVDHDQLKELKLKN
jgi:predicted transcriptional regulator